MIRHLLLIENPNSGQTKNDLSHLRECCASQGWQLKEYQLNSKLPLSDILSGVENYDAVIGVGGDGTISSIASLLSNSQIPLLTWPGGTGNLVAQNLFLDLSPEHLCEALLKWQIQRVDMGQLKTDSKLKNFLMLAGAGMDAQMIHSSESLKPDWGLASYAISLLGQLGKEASAIDLIVDGQKIDESHAVGVMVANLGRVNLRLPLGQTIQAQDQCLDVIVIRELSPELLVTEFWNSLWRQVGATVDYHSDIGIYRGRSIQLKATPALPLQYDGEVLHDSTPVSFEIKPEALWVFADKEALDAPTLNPLL